MREATDGQVQRVRIGLTGLAFVFLLVLLGAAISRWSQDPPTANEVIANVRAGRAQRAAGRDWRGAGRILGRRTKPKTPSEAMRWTALALLALMLAACSRRARRRPKAPDEADRAAPADAAAVAVRARISRSSQHGLAGVQCAASSTIG